MSDNDDVLHRMVGCHLAKQGFQESRDAIEHIGAALTAGEAVVEPAVRIAMFHTLVNGLGILQIAPLLLAQSRVGLHSVLILAEGRSQMMECLLRAHKWGNIEHDGFISQQALEFKTSFPRLVVAMWGQFDLVRWYPGIDCFILIGL